MLVAPTLFLQFSSHHDLAAPLRPAPPTLHARTTTTVYSRALRPLNHSYGSTSRSASTTSSQSSLGVKRSTYSLNARLSSLQSSNHQAIKLTPATPLPLPSLATSLPTSATPG